jgi:hypothetical protein
LESLPTFPDSDISKFEEWLKHNPAQTLFYFNYMPRSGQRVPFSDHDDILIPLCAKHAGVNFILPKTSDRLSEHIKSNGITNIINCSELFDCMETNTCENLCKLTKIFSLCDYSVHYDIGACFHYVNDKLHEAKNMVLHVGCNTFYFDKFASHYDPAIFNSKAKFLECANPEGVIESVSAILTANPKIAVVS